MKLRIRSALCAAVLFLVGCQDMSPEWKGRLTGGVLGGFIGSELTGGSAAGAVAGGVIGSAIGEHLAVHTRLQKTKISHTLEHSRSGVATVWNDPDHEVRYVLVPQSAERHAKEVCRPFKFVIESTEGREVIHGVACRHGKEQWLIKQG